MRAKVEASDDTSLPGNTLQISHGEKNSCRTGIHATGSSNPDWTVDCKGSPEEVGFLGLSLSWNMLEYGIREKRKIRSEHEERGHTLLEDTLAQVIQTLPRARREGLELLEEGSHGSRHDGCGLFDGLLMKSVVFVMEVQSLRGEFLE
jgi:hypothetical protein